MSPDTAYPPIICTDDGWLLQAAEPPLSIEELKEKMVAAYAGTPAALWWSIGDHEIYHYETQIGQLASEATDDGASTRIAANLANLTKTCGGPLTALIELCRAANIQLFPRVRMNSHYDVDPAAPGFGRFRQEHPQLLIGRPGVALPEGSTVYGLRTGLDYVFPEVRTYMAGIICELFERFDVEGLELDFMRHPAFFHPAQAFQHRHYMTDLIICVRAAMIRAGSDRGRPIKLAIRVPPTLADSARIGLDVAHWMAEGLVDVVIAGGGFIPYETPIEEFVAAGDGIAVYGCIESTRYADEKNLRAIASRFWAAGASGIYLYNFYTMSPAWNRRVLNQLADPKTLHHLDKRFELDQTARFTTPYHCAYPCDNIECTFRYANPAAQLPLILEEIHSDAPPLLHLEIPDDLESASREGLLDRCFLTLRLDAFTPGDELAVQLNGETIPQTSRRICFDGWKRQEVEAQFWDHYPTQIVEVQQSGTSIEYDLNCPPFKQGENVLEIRLTSKSDEREPVILKGVETLITYISVENATPQR